GLEVEEDLAREERVDPAEDPARAQGRLPQEGPPLVVALQQYLVAGRSQQGVVGVGERHGPARRAPAARLVEAGGEVDDQVAGAPRRVERVIEPDAEVRAQHGAAE